MTEFAADEMSYAPGVLKPSRAAVHVKVSHGNRKPVLLEYRLHRAEKGWKTFDVIVDGISLVMVYRSSFSAEIRKRGLDGLIEHLAAKNRKRAKRRDL